MTEPRFVVMFSGGIGSWGAACRVIEQHGKDDVTLLFADTLIEDPDLYRFLNEAAAQLDVPLVRVADGRNPWQVFRDERMLGNSRIAPCSHLLKQKPTRKWMADNAPEATVVLGIDWTEQHRLAGAIKGWAPWTVVAPLCEQPWVSKQELIATLSQGGIEPPALYRQGFPHNNCGGGCVRAGIGQFAHLLRTKPDTFQQWETEEQGLREFLDRDVAILRSRRGSRSRPFTLRALREREEVKPGMFDGEDWGGCGCFLVAEPTGVTV